ncbi:hypothetical protein K523DRAFT_356351 [Schizophyllum commune Tattone D]|nr:hypothetical protein K523DRAFT_356351 [Schizophyllum commune Tattone D]
MAAPPPLVTRMAFQPDLMLLPFLNEAGQLEHRLFNDPTQVVLTLAPQERKVRPYRHPVNGEQHEYESDVDVLPADAVLYDRNPNYPEPEDVTDSEGDEDARAVHPQQRRKAKKETPYVLHPQFWHSRGWPKRSGWTDDPVDVGRVIDVLVPTHQLARVQQRLNNQQTVKIHTVRVRQLCYSPELWPHANRPNIQKRVRLPELFANPTAEEREVTELVDAECRVVRVPGSLTGVSGKKFVFPPLEVNDQFERRSFFYGDTDWPETDDICVPDCSAESPRTWSPALFESSRLCTECTGIFHTRCLVRGQFLVSLEAPDVVAAIQEKPTLAHLRVLLDRHIQALPLPPYYNYGFGNEKEENEDVLDAMGEYPLVETTFAEVAAMPLRRKCYPGVAPQTLEVVIQWARERVTQGEGDVLLTEDALRAELRRLHMEPVLRAAKIILLRYLRLLRHHVHRLFRCPQCGMDSLI